MGNENELEALVMNGDQLDDLITALEQDLEDERG